MKILKKMLNINFYLKTFLLLFAYCLIILGFFYTLLFFVFILIQNIQMT